jgi:stage IV sporulation protein FB
MGLFQPPATTRFDLQFSLLGVPVRVHPLFWLMAVIFGYGNGDLTQLVIWVAVVFVSILIHEMGHALMFRRFGQAAEVVLYIGGGLAVPRSEWVGRRRTNVELTTGERIAVSLAGPGAGFAFAILVMMVVVVLGGRLAYSPILGIIPAVSAFVPPGFLLNSIVGALLWINIFWGVINLVPVLPLDGGNVAYQLLTQADPLYGERKALWLSVIAGVITAVVGLLFLRSNYMAFLFGMLAIQSYERVNGGARRYY